MTSRDLLLEIGLEELPARFVTSAMNQFAENVSTWLSDHKINFTKITAYSTPRRLAVLVSDVSETQADSEEELRGPAKKIALAENGEWSKAAIGFTRGQGMSVEDIYFKEIKGIDYVHIKKFTKGERTETLLPQLQEIITSLHFPINMRWGSNSLRYIRPIKWLVSLFGEELIPFSITNVASGRTTLGHRFLGEKTTINNPASYEEELKKQFVIVDPDERKKLIEEQIKALEKVNNWIIHIDEELLEEVVNLVEYPTALTGSFEEHFLDLPEEVLVTSMREHQRYFSVRDENGKLLPHFVTVRNGNDEHLEKVARGNEKVLKARLADGEFFFEEDKRQPIDAFLTKLETVVYHEEIGTITDKTERVRKLTNKLSEKLSFTDEEKQLSNRAAQICKFDLVTLMVNEFPELQGTMGQKYALLLGEHEDVARAVEEHYRPRFAGDKPPKSNVSALVSLADKLDTIASFFAIGVIPSGSQDPYALRRQATGVVETLISKNWDFNLQLLIELAIEELAAKQLLKEDLQTVTDNLLNFFQLRLKYKLQELKIDHDIIDAVLIDGNISSIQSLISRAQVLKDKKGTQEFKGIVEALSRILNISRDKEKTAEVNESLFQNDYEKALFDKITAITENMQNVKTAVEQFDLLATATTEINNYFDHTMIMVEDESLRQNRLNQMVSFAELINSFAAVNKILIK